MTKKQAKNMMRFNKLMEKRDIEQKRWETLVEARKAMCYIKPTRYIHDSGFRTFEVGYCTPGKKNNIDKKLVLRVGSDHIHTDYMALIDGKRGFGINMDLTLDGYIRIWGSERQCVVWESMPMSSAELTLKEYAGTIPEEIKVK